MIAISIMMEIMINAILIKMVKIIVILGLLMMIKSHNDSTNHNDDSKGKTPCLLLLKRFLNRKRSGYMDCICQRM